jgi:hypothetical protein
MQNPPKSILEIKSPPDAPRRMSQVAGAFQESTSGLSSHFLSTVLLHQPITIYYRSRAADEFVTIALQLKNKTNDVDRSFSLVYGTIPITFWYQK